MVAHRPSSAQVPPKGYGPDTLRTPADLYTEHWSGRHMEPTEAGSLESQAMSASPRAAAWVGSSPDIAQPSHDSVGESRPQERKSHEPVLFWCPLPAASGWWWDGPQAWSGNIPCCWGPGHHNWLNISCRDFGTWHAKMAWWTVRSKEAWSE